MIYPVDSAIRFSNNRGQESADAAKRQLLDLSNKIDHTLHPVFKSGEISEDLDAWAQTTYN